MRRLLLIWACTYGLGQDTIGAEARVRGDYVEVDFWWRSGVGYVPVAANFVLVWPEAHALSWPQVAMTQRGSWDAAQSPLYRPLYITQRLEDTAQRVSLNLLPQDPAQGLPIPNQRTLVGQYRVPIAQFGPTLQPRWGMESGEVVGLARRGEKNRFVFVPVGAVTLCPSVAGFRVQVQGGELSLLPPADFRPENLTITWYYNGQPIGNGAILSIPAQANGLFYAEVVHRCGSSAWSDTLAFSTTGVGLASQGAWHVYPLPAREVLYVIAPEQAPCTYELSDLSGRKLLQGRWESGDHAPHTIDLSGFPAGTYLLRLSQSTTQTFLICHVW